MDDHELLSDVALVGAARDGDKVAFGELLRRHQPLLRGLCVKVTGDRTLAEDLCQETAMQALLCLGNLQDPTRFGAWLAGIGLNVCRRHLRGRIRDQVIVAAVADAEAANGSRRGPTDPADVAEVRITAAAVRCAIDALPRGQREAVALYYLAGFTQREAAAALEVEEGAIKTRLHKARASLRRRLAHAREVDEMTQQPTESDLVVMHVTDVRRVQLTDGGNRYHVVVLGERDGDRELPIWVGEAEATAIAVQVEKVGPPRPLTAQFMAELITASGARLLEVRINRLADTVFYAEAVVDGAAGERVIDARPSDAINLALALQAPIRVSPFVLAQTAADVKRGLVEAAIVDHSVGAADIVSDAIERMSTFSKWAGDPTTTDPEAGRS